MNQPTTCPVSADLKALLHGLLPAAEEATFSAHLERCPRCQYALQALAASGASWAGLPSHLGDTPSPPEPALLAALASLAASPSAHETLPAEAGDGQLSLDFLDPPEQPGSIGRMYGYEALEVIGSGGMGIVLKARHLKLDRVVAIKVLMPQLAGLHSARVRFLREARTAAALDRDHNIVTLYEVSEVKGLPFLAMEYVEGMSLEERLRQGPLPLAEVVRIGAAVARGLAAAHARGLMHRDIKPANILLEAGSGRVKLTDFGLARAVDDATLTQSGTVAGTPQYMAPEQARGEPIDHRADLFSLGSVLYAMCTGRPPFEGGMPLAVLRRVADETPPPVRAVNESIPPWLEAIVERLHARAAAERFSSAAEVADLLEGRLAQLQSSSALAAATQVIPVVQPSPRPRPRKLRGWLGLAALLLLAGLGVAALQMGKALLRTPAGKHAETGASSSEADSGEPDQQLAHALPAIPEPKLSGRKAEILLPEPFTHVRTGGGGRYLIFHLEKAKKLAIFDVSQAKITHEVEVPADALYAAGRDRLLIVHRGQRLIKRLDLRSGHCDRIVPAPQGILSAHMGCNGNGPLLLFVGGKLIGWDVEEMKQADMDDRGLGGDPGYHFQTRISADGQAVVVWHAGLLNQNYALVHLRRPKNVLAISPDGHSFNERWALPAADGSLVFRAHTGIYDGAMRPLPADAFKGMVLLPSEDPRFFLAIAEESRTTNKVSICASAERAAVFTVGGVEKMTSSSLDTRWGLVDGEPRIHYLPSANVLVSLPESNDRVVLRPFNLFKALDQSGRDYLFVLSRPARNVAPESAFEYRMDVKSKAGGLRYKLESGPRGMTVSDTGVVRWQVPVRSDRPVRVIVTIRSASGKEVQHAFDLAVTEPAPEAENSPPNY